MQTFLPYPDFAMSAKCLDNKRLGKQRVECLQILNVLAIGPYQFYDGSTGKWEACRVDHNQYSKTRKTPWYNHPAVKMWRGKTKLLAKYGLTVCREWTKRGFNDTCYYKVFPFYNPDDAVLNYLGSDPLWLGNEQFHASHRSNLLRKDPTHYGQFGWTEPHDLPYVWPV